MGNKELNIERAIERTKKAEESIKKIENILKYRLNRDDKDVWKVIGTIYYAGRISTVDKERHSPYFVK